jgi:hypothetical protein
MNSDTSLRTASILSVTGTQAARPTALRQVVANFSYGVHIIPEACYEVYTRIKGGGKHS